MFQGHWAGVRAACSQERLKSELRPALESGPRGSVPIFLGPEAGPKPSSIFAFRLLESWGLSSGHESVGNLTLCPTLSRARRPGRPQPKAHTTPAEAQPPHPRRAPASRTGCGRPGLGHTDRGWQVPGIRHLSLLGSASSLLVTCLPLRQVGCWLRAPTGSSASPSGLHVPCIDIIATWLLVCLPPGRISERAWFSFGAASCPQHLTWGLAQVRYHLNGEFVNGLMEELVGCLSCLAQDAKERA